MGKSEDEVALRYTDLKNAVSASEGPVADRTLSRALADLSRRGHLRRDPKGREVLYRLTIPRVEQVAAFAKSDSDAIRSAAQLGGLADLSEGWAYYGIPDLFKDRLRGRLRRAGRAHRKAIEEILGSVVDETVRAVLRRGRGRLSRKALFNVEDALYAVVQRTAVGWLTVARGLLVWSNIETMMPGALVATRRAIGVEGFIPKGSIDAEYLAEVWSRILHVPADELRKVFDRELRQIERYQAVLEQYFSVLSPKERDMVGTDLTTLMALVANLTAVTRL